MKSRITLETDRRRRSLRVATLFLLALAAPRLGAGELPAILADVFPGSSSSLPLPGTAIAMPRTLVAVGATTFFGANDGVHGVELWRSGASQSGAVLVRDILPGAGSAAPRNMVEAGGLLFFVADDAVSGRELWRSDGTETGTFRVKDILAGPGTSAPEDLVDSGGTLYFGAWDGSGYALWRSDGTEAGTFAVKYVGFPRELAAVGDKIFFIGVDPASGRELWVSDGTAPGTFRVKDIVPGSGSPTTLDSLVDVGGTLFFRALGELWRSDGTEAGTFRVRNVAPAGPQGGSACGNVPLHHFAVVGGILFFSGESPAELGPELWRSDGTEAGTFRVRDIYPGTAPSNIQCVVAIGDTIFFGANDGTTGNELWRSDGTAAGTVRIKDIVAGPSASAPHFLAAVGDTLFFSASDAAGTELWRSDGTEAGTVRVADPAGSSDPQSLIEGGGALFFTANDAIRGREPWILAARPIANAGPDQTVGEATMVTLDGSGSTDPSGDPLSFAWTQIAGPPVVLGGAPTPAPQFEAPAVASGGATLTFALTVDDGAHVSDADTVDITVKNVNTAPTARAGADQAVQEGSPVTLHGGDSFDPDGDALTYRWIQIAGTAVSLSDASAIEPAFAAPFVGSSAETLAFALTVSDGVAESTDAIEVIVTNVNQVPVANAGADQTIDEGTSAMLDGTASSDPDADPLTYAWVQIAGSPVQLSDATSPTPGFTAGDASPGGDILVFQLVVSDASASSEPDAVTIFVRDSNQAPACALAQPSPSRLWPPSHKLVRVAIAGVADPDDSDVRITITGVTQDEPVNGLGDGDTGPDAVLAGDAVLLRAERSGWGSGRVYLVTFTAEDIDGGVCTGSVSVCVPRDGRTELCLDDGQNFDSLVP